MKTITRSELARLSFCNSAKLPPVVNVEGRAREWVGIGWIDMGPVRAGIPTMVENDDQAAKRGATSPRSTRVKRSTPPVAARRTRRRA